MSPYRIPASVSLTPEQWIRLGLKIGLTLDQFQEAVANLVPSKANAEKGDYFTPLQDKDVPQAHLKILAEYRALATEWSVPVTTALCYRVRAGFTLKQHAPMLGTCYEDFQYLQSWNFTDTPTSDCYAFWIPRIVPGSTRKNVTEQLKLLAELRSRLELPSRRHLASFGTAPLLAGLILTHFKAMGERIPLGSYWTRTDTCDADGHRLTLSWNEGALDCGSWGWVDGRRGFVGGVALGVEALGSSGSRP